MVTVRSGKIQRGILQQRFLRNQRLKNPGVPQRMEPLQMLLERHPKGTEIQPDIKFINSSSLRWWTSQAPPSLQQGKPLQCSKSHYGVRALLPSLGVLQLLGSLCEASRKWNTAAAKGMSLPLWRQSETAQSFLWYTLCFVPCWELWQDGFPKCYQQML